MANSNGSVVVLVVTVAVAVAVAAVVCVIVVVAIPIGVMDFQSCSREKDLSKKYIFENNIRWTQRLTARRTDGLTDDGWTERQIDGQTGRLMDRLSN